MKRLSHLLCLLLAIGMAAPFARAAQLTASLKEGKPIFKSMGPITFGPEGILFIADTKSAAITAVATSDSKPTAGAQALKVEGINQKLAGLLGSSADQLLIEDIAAFVFWIAGFFGSTIVWRGRRYRLLRDGRFRLVSEI